LKILLTPIGSHGDVHPFVGLGLELQRRGHRVIVITNPHFQKLIARAGLEFVPLGVEDDYHTALADPDVWHPRRGFRLFLGYLVTLMRPLYERVLEQHEPGNTVVVKPSTALGARVAQDKLQIPMATVHLQPSGLRSVADPPLLPGVWLPAWAPAFVRRMIYWGGDRFMIAPVIEPPLNAFRAELGLAPVRFPFADWWNSPQRILALFPEWFAPMAADWPAQTRLCGFPLFDQGGMTDLPPELEAFLQAGDAPIVFTPGSAMRHGRAFFEAAVDACQRLQRRGLLLTVHPDHLPQILPETIRSFTYIPFSQVFPRVAAVVHHGGIGTTSQALAAGIPQLIMPMGFDQPDNAARLERLGVALSLAPHHFTAANVATQLQPLLLPAVRRRCQEIATRLANHRALEQSCELIEALAKE
jgi:UDP:flavonoid glycosyltransferase YjiC (YdhE family)